MSGEKFARMMRKMVAYPAKTKPNYQLSNCESLDRRISRAVALSEYFNGFPS